MADEIRASYERPVPVSILVGGILVAVYVLTLTFKGGQIAVMGVIGLAWIAFLTY